MGVQENTVSILRELEQNALNIDNDQAQHFIGKIRNAKHIFLQGAGRSGIAIRAFANRLLHLGFSVSVVGEISSPHTKAGDLLIIGSGSGETGSLKSLAQKAVECGVDVALVTMKKTLRLASWPTACWYYRERSKLKTIALWASFRSQWVPLSSNSALSPTMPSCLNSWTNCVKPVKPCLNDTLILSNDTERFAGSAHSLITSHN